METRRSLQLRETQERWEEEAKAMKQPEPSNGSNEQSESNVLIEDEDTLEGVTKRDRSHKVIPLLGLDQEGNDSILEAIKEGYTGDSLTKANTLHCPRYSARIHAESPHSVGIHVDSATFHVDPCGIHTFHVDLHGMRWPLPHVFHMDLQL
jgi:hypothetical protein